MTTIKDENAKIQAFSKCAKELSDARVAYKDSVDQAIHIVCGEVAALLDELNRDESAPITINEMKVELHELGGASILNIVLDVSRKDPKGGNIGKWYTAWKTILRERLNCMRFIDSINISAASNNAKF